MAGLDDGRERSSEAGGLPADAGLGPAVPEARPMASLEYINPDLERPMKDYGHVAFSHRTVARIEWGCTWVVLPIVGVMVVLGVLFLMSVSGVSIFGWRP
jgi:hypothetical protein